MKNMVLVLGFILSSVGFWAQQPAMQQPAQPEPQIAATNLATRVSAPSESDIYCGGFVTNQPVPSNTFIAGGLNTPQQTRYSGHEFIYLSGAGFQEGQRFSIVRHLRELNQSSTRGRESAMLNVGYHQNLLSGLGEAYGELGRVRVTSVRGPVAIAQVELSCDSFLQGDLAVPFVERPRPAFHRPVPFDRFAPANGKLMGRIVMAREFDTILGNHNKVYLNVGADQGVKVGDYFRAVRTYPEVLEDRVDAVSFKAKVYDDSQKYPPAFPTARLQELPRRSLGEMIVLNVTPKTSTAMVTMAVEDIHIGDKVEMEEELPPLPAPAAPAANPPSISCSASPATIRVGERSTITCDAASPDNRPLTFTYTATRGQLTPRDNRAMLDTRDAGPGPISVQATVSDDRNLTAAASTDVNVEALPATPVARKLNELQFAHNSARVDNRAKAILDDVALQMQREPDSSLGLVSYTEEKEADRLANQRSQNVSLYLTKEKGIDAKRVQAGPGQKGGRKTDVWALPPGTSVPQ